MIKHPADWPVDCSPPPNGVFVVEYQTAALKALNNKDSQRKTVKSMTVSNRALIFFPII